MKKIFISSIVALALILGSAGSASAAFSSYLTVGSTGADVTALQSWLITNGFDIPSISAGTAAKGYFGQQTKAAVVKYQASVGLPATGFVGPLTIAKLNGTAGVSMTPVSCPIGYTCSANTPVVAPSCPLGYTCVANTTTGTTVNTGTTGTIMTPGVAGSLALSLQATPSNGTSLSKGQEADVVTYKIQAGASDMSLTSIALDVNNRLWLYASSITVLDGSTVIAGKSNLSVNDFTELTVGTSYRLTLPVSGYVIPRAGTRYLTVHLKMLATTDRSSSATISFTQVQTRAVDGTGVVDTQTLASARTFSYTGTNNGQVVVTLASDSPVQGLKQISQSSQTDNVLLAKYNIKSQNIAGTLRNLTLTVGTTGRGVTQLFGDIKLSVNGHWYSADSVGTTTTFTNMNEVLPADQYIPVSVYGKINQDTNGTLLTGVIASTTLAASGTAGGTSNNPSIEDASYSALAVNSNTVISSDLTFSSSSAVLSGLSATVGSGVQSNNTTVAFPVTFSFTLTAGDNTLYMSNKPGLALSTTTTGYAVNSSLNASTTITSVTATPGTVAGDNNVTTTGYFVIPAGSSRTFTFSGTVKNEANTGPILRTFAVTAVKYGTSNASDTTLTANTINYNLDTLKVTPVI